LASESGSGTARGLAGAPAPFMDPEWWKKLFFCLFRSLQAGSLVLAHFSGYCEKSPCDFDPR
jgi:hypothetical protein